MKWTFGLLFLSILIVITLMVGILFINTNPSFGQDNSPGSDLPSLNANNEHLGQGISDNSIREIYSIQLANDDELTQAAADKTIGSTDVQNANSMIQDPGWKDEPQAIEIKVDLTQAPYTPTLIIPADGADPVHLQDQESVALQTMVSAPDGRELTASFYGRPSCIDSNFTLVALPDTQYYSAEIYNARREMFDAQTQWIIDNRSAWNIAYVTGLGDIVDSAADTAQWDVAGSVDDPIGALTRLENAGIPYGLAVGNHDGGPNNTLNFNAYFPIGRFGDGHYGDDNDNNYSLFSAGGMDFILIHLEYEASDDVLAWANDLLSNQFPDRRAIVVSHDLLGDFVNPAPFSNNGSKIFEALKGNANLFLMLGGHLVGGVSRTDVVDGHTIYSLRSDYQEESGGNGWLRLMEFQPASDQIQVYTYSPYLDEWKSDSTNYFTFDYDMPGSDCAPFELIQTAPDLKSGSTPEIYWSNRSIDSKYEWKVAVSDGVNTVESPVRSFTAGEGPYTPISVSIDGSSTGVIRRPNSFTASVTPDNVDSQLTYLWSATEQPMVSHQNNLVDSVEFSWNTGGRHQVTLLVFNSESSVINTFSIDQYKPVSANFRFTPLGKFAPDVMFFANRSTGVYDACKWDFGDGTTSNKCKIRAHIFPGAGVYRVTLTVSGPAGTTSLTRVINTDNPRMPEIQIFLPIVSDQDPDDK